MSKRQTAESECRDCHAKILWASSSTGGRLPLNLEPEKITGTNLGPFYILNEFDMVCTKADLSVIEQAIEEQRSLYSNHVVTCERRGRSAA